MSEVVSIPSRAQNDNGKEDQQSITAHMHDEGRQGGLDMSSSHYTS